MSIGKLSVVGLVVAAFACGFVLRAAVAPAAIVHAAANRVFEIRTYTTPPGKLDALKARFRDHTIALFTKHDMTSVGYWVPQDAPMKDNTLIYVLAHPSREEAAKNWAAFRADPDWVKAKAESEKDGPLTTKVESVFVDPTDFSPIK
jgi:ribosomal protein L3